MPKYAFQTLFLLPSLTNVVLFEKQAWQAFNGTPYSLRNIMESPARLPKQENKTLSKIPSQNTAALSKTIVFHSVGLKLNVPMLESAKHVI